MSYEILYTSAPSGLKPGSSGYCTVQGSRGIPAPAVDLLESLSGYRHVFTPGSPDATHNPVNWGHYLIRIAGRVEHVLSRVGDCELDYTGRSNKLAHHLVVDAPKTATLPGGPAWFLSRPGLMYDRWDGTVSHLGTPRFPPPERRTAGQCAAWGGATGDAGWGGVLAESFLADPERKVFVVYAPGTNVLALFEEAIALLPEHRRWDVAFATYGAALPKTVDCLWSGLIAGSPEVAQSHRFVNALRIDLTAQVGRAVGGPLVELARTGTPATPTRPTTRPPTNSPPPLPVSDPVYEGGYQPVPPPPGVLQPLGGTYLNEPEPPSLPPRNRPVNSSFRWLALVTLSALLFVSIISTAAWIVMRKWSGGPPPLDVAKSDDPAAIQASPDEGSERSTGIPDPVGRKGVSPKQEGQQDSEEKSAPGIGSEKPGSAEMPAQEPKTEEKRTESDASKPDPAKAASPDKPGSETERKPEVKTDKDRKVRAAGSEPDTSQSMPQKPSGEATPDNGPSDTPTQQGNKAAVVVTSERTPQVREKANEEVSVEFGKNSSISLENVKNITLYVPRGREEEKTGENYFERTSQHFENNECHVTPHPVVGVPDGTEFIAGVGVKDGIFSLKLKTAKAIPVESWRVCLSHGIFHMQDASGNEVAILALTHPAPSKKFPQIKNLEVQFAADNHIDKLIRTVHRGDVFLDDIAISFNDKPLAANQKGESSPRWSLAEQTDGFIQSLQLSDNDVVTPKNEIRLQLTTSPEMKRLDKTVKSEDADLARVFKSLKPYCNTGLGPLTMRNFAHGNTSNFDTEFDEACKDVETAIRSSFDTQKKITPNNTQALDDQLKGVLKIFDEYVNGTRILRKHRKVIETVNSKISITRGTLKYRAWKIGLKADAATASPPRTEDYKAAELWKFGNSM